MLATPPIEYSAPATCPDASDFQARVDARIAGAPDAASAAGVRSLRVVVEDQPGSYVGRLTVRDEDGTESTRELAGTSCAELVDALAFMSAVSIGLVEPARPQDGTPPGPGPYPSPPTVPPAAREAPSHTRPVEPWLVTVGVHSVATSLFGGVSVGPAVFVELGKQGRGLWSPAFRVSAVRVGSGTFGVASGGDATVRLTGVRFEACPVHFAPARDTLSLIPCAGVQAGDLSGNGANISNAQSASRFWIAADALGRLEVALLSWLVADLQVGLTVPLVRHEFIFAPNSAIYDVPAAAASAEMGLGIRFP